MNKNKKLLTEQERKDKILKRLQSEQPITIYDEKCRNRYTYIKNSFVGDCVLKQSTLTTETAVMNRDTQRTITVDEAIDEIVNAYRSKIQTMRKFRKRVKNEI